jgi:hypothetical protein
MAREEYDREDLLAEVGALVERASLEIFGDAEPVIVGFRRDGAASFYFGGQRVYHFTSDGELRRAFVDGLLYKAQRRRLASLERHRTTQAVELVRHDLSDAEQEAFLAEVGRYLETLRVTLAGSQYRLVGQVPDDADVLARVRHWLANLAARVTVAESPRSR